VPKVRAHAPIAAPAKTALIAPRAAKKSGALDTLDPTRTGGKRELWSEKDKAIAVTLARIAKDNPDATSFRELARVAQEELPGLEDFHVVALKKRHPDTLAGVESRGMHAPVPAPARERIVELALAHPTLDYGQLAVLFAKDAKLKGVLEWSEEEVSRLREPSRIVPSERKRQAALVEIAVEHLTAATGDLDGALKSLAKVHPGVTREQIVSLGAHEPTLAKQIRRLEGDAPAVGASTLTIDLQTAKKLDLGWAIIERGIGSRLDGVVAEMSAAITKLEKNAGNNDGNLAPRDLSDVDPLLGRVIARVYEDVGKKSHPIEVITAGLSSAIAKLADKGRRANKDTDLYRRATEETIRALAADYKKEVIDGGASVSGFYLDRKIVSKIWVRIKEQIPGAFPDPADAKAEPGRLKAISELYTQLLDGDLTTTGFYARAKISADQLRLLQSSDPDSFPRPAGTPSWKTVVGRREVNAIDVDALAKKYKYVVVSGDKSLGDFLRDEGVSKHRFVGLRAEHPTKFTSLTGLKAPDAVLAKALGHKARAEFKRDVLIDVPEILAKLNANPELVELVGGKISRNRYEVLRSKFPEHFPKFKDPSLVLPVLADEVREILAKKPGLNPVALTAAMQKLHPRFNMSRLSQLRETSPDLVPSQAAKKIGDRQADAELLAARMRADPGRTLQELAEDLGPRFDKDYLSRLRKDFRSTIFDSGPIAFKGRSIARESLAANELYAMAVRLSPPGTNQVDLVKALDALLEARGLPTYGSQQPPAGMVKALEKNHGGIEAQGAAMVKEIAWEYARAAPKGTSEKEIFDAILADYPSLDKFKMTTYRKTWGGAPLVGQGKVVDDPRFIGGWDVERALLGPARTDPALAKGLARLSAHARMPLTLPLLDKIVEDLDGKKPLAHKNLLWVTHVLASTYALSVALRQAGVAASASIVVGTPYGTNDTVKATLIDDGFDVRKPALDPKAYRAEVEKAVDEMVKLHKKNHHPVVVMDDGGLVAEILRSDPKYKDVMGAFKIVEQTTRGITAAEQDTVSMPVINVARSKSKMAEAALIGRAVAAKVLQGLKRLGKDLKKENVTVVGYGAIGAKIAAELRKAGALVTVVEPSADRAKKAAKAGFTVASKEQAFPKSNVVIGSSGVTSIGLTDLKRLPNGAVFASASSKRLEIDMEALEKAASSSHEIASDTPLVTLPTRAYKLGGKEITALGDGWPINFDGDVEDIPPEEIQLTRAVMLAGAIQAGSVKTNQVANKGVIPLDEKLDDSVLEGWRALMKGRKTKSPIGDPSGWADILRSSAALIRGAIEGA